MRPTRGTAAECAATFPCACFRSSIESVGKRHFGIGRDMLVSPLLLVGIGVVIVLALLASTLMLSSTPTGPTFDESIAMLQSIEKPERERAVQRLVELRDVDGLIVALGHVHRNVREGAATALGRLGPDAAPAVPALIEAFEDPDDYVRWKAAEALGEIGPAAKDALPMLDAAANAKQIDVITQAAARKAVQQIRGGR